MDSKGTQTIPSWMSLKSKVVYYSLLVFYSSHPLEPVLSVKFYSVDVSGCGIWLISTLEAYNLTFVWLQLRAVGRFNFWERHIMDVVANALGVAFLDMRSMHYEIDTALTLICLLVLTIITIQIFCTLWMNTNIYLCMNAILSLFDQMCYSQGIRHTRWYWGQIVNDEIHQTHDSRRPAHASSKEDNSCRLRSTNIYRPQYSQHLDFLYVGSDAMPKLSKQIWNPKFQKSQDKRTWKQIWNPKYIYSHCRFLQAVRAIQHDEDFIWGHCHAWSSHVYTVSNYGCTERTNNDIQP